MKFDLMEIGKYYIIEDPVDDGPGIHFIFIKDKGFDNKKYFIICDIYETSNYKGLTFTIRENWNFSKTRWNESGFAMSKPWDGDDRYFKSIIKNIFYIDTVWDMEQHAR